MSPDEYKKEGAARLRSSPRGIRWLFHVLVLWSFAAAQPLYSKIADNIPFLLAHKLDSTELVLYAICILLLPPVLIWAGIVFSSVLSRRFSGFLQRTVILFLVGLLLFPVLDRVGLPQTVALLLGFGLGLVPAVLYGTRFWLGLLDLLIPAPAVFIAVFLLFSPARTLLFGGEGEAGQGARGNLEVPVVILMLDELSTQAVLDRNGELDSDRLPGFARLAETSTWYPRATTVVEATVMAAPVILSGMLPQGDRHQPPVFQNFPENLFDQVSAERKVWAVENGSRLCRPQRCETAQVDLSGHGRLGRWKRLMTDTLIIYGHMVLPDWARSRWLPELGTRWADFAGEGDAPDAAEGDIAPRDIRWGQRNAEFAAFIDELGNVGPGTLHYLHLLLPHAPWIYLPDGKAYDINRSDSINGMMPDSANDTGIKHMWWDDEWATVIGEQRFLMQVHYVDSLIDQMLDTLSQSENFEELMLVVVADHGGSFTPGTSRRALTEENFAEILPIPLFVKYPGQTSGKRSDAPAELLDVSPTVRKALGLDVDGLDGQPLQESSEERLLPRLVNDRGEYIEFSGEVFERNFATILERMHQRFAFSEPDGFVMLADRSDAYGQRVEDFAAVVEESSELVFTPNNAGLWHDYSQLSRLVPSRFLGRLAGSSSSDIELLIALNGRVAGFSRPFSYPEADGLVEAMLLPELLVFDGNELAVYEVAGNNDRPILRGIPFSDAAGDTVPAEVRAVSDDRDDVIGRWIEPALLEPNQGVVLKGTWHSGGPDIRWVGEQAEICFGIDPAGRSYRFEFAAIPFLHEREVTAQRVQIMVDSKRVADLTLGEHSLDTHRVDLPSHEMDGQAPLCVQLFLPDARVPNEVGANSDRRNLGIAISKFRLTQRIARDD